MSKEAKELGEAMTKQMEFFNHYENNEILKSHN